ncbi:S1 family peptidase [Mycobacterium sp. MYCO198283]|uniref:S1 family peptidase n=1 Tax=Mycobacterium sp. MYCO198283 TaxID=2883505 RepID=UPI001E5246D8|nr:S1 family peptidase [Mycobacterium sp. MYCO198283]MCG5432805.1 S1 family peptidase [Mycobacterium sp. MYCO198283]
MRTACHILAAATLLVIGLLAAPASAADGRVPLGGGAGIVVDNSSLCTLTAIGTDNRGKLVGFTSAHCGGPGAAVAAEAARDRGTIGTMVAGNEGLDYAVVEFDPALVAPVSTYDGFTIAGLGPDPAFGEVACKLGRTTGYTCGVTWGPGEQPGTILNQVCGQPGDSGAPVTVNNRLVGMIHGAFSDALPTCVVKYVPLHTPAVTMSINAQLADMAAKNRAGAGFRPVA